MGILDNFRALAGEPSREERIVEEQGEYQLVSPSTVGEEQLIERGGMDIARAVAPSSVIFFEDYFKLNELYVRVIFIESWPTDVSPNWLREIYQWHRAMDISIYYQPLPVKSLLNKLRQKSARELAEIEKDEMEGNSVDFERVQRLEDALRLQEMLQRGETKPFQVSFLIAIRAESLAELNELTVAIEKQFDAMSARTRRAELRQKDAFLSVLPFGRNYIADAYTTRNMHTQAAMYSFPLANADLSHPSGIWYGVNRSTNSNVILDRFRLQSPHSIILGASGSGKSYAAKLEMLRALMDGMPVMVVDPDAECERLCAETGGQFITIGPASPDRINVLDFSHMADGEEDHLTAKIHSVIRLIGSMMNPSGEGYGLNAEQVEILDRLLREIYAEWGYTQDPRTQAQATKERMPIFSDVRARLERFVREHEHDPRKAQLMSEVVAAIGPYCTGGAYGGLFDQHTTVELRAQFVVFNIKPLTQARDDHLLTLGMHSVLEFIYNAVMNKRVVLSGVRRLLFVDEAHVMMRSPESASFLEDLARRARKCNVGLTVLTQAPEDFVRPDRPQGRLIFDNASMLLVLRMKRRSLEVLQDLLGLDDVEVDLLSTRETGEGMIFAMNDRVWIDLHTASPEEHEMITTNPDEVAEIEARRRLELEPGEADDHRGLDEDTHPPALPSGGYADALAEEMPAQAPRRPQRNFPQASFPTSVHQQPGLTSGPPKRPEQPPPHQPPAASQEQPSRVPDRTRRRHQPPGQGAHT